MSYLGRKPIKIPKGVTIEISDNIDITGPLGSLSRTLDKNIKIEILKKSGKNVLFCLFTG